MSNKIINKLISILNNQDLDALALVPGSNFRYVTGGNFHLMERPTLFIVSKTYKPIAILPHDVCTLLKPESQSIRIIGSGKIQ